MADTKRRLPMLKSEPAEETRPRWQWIGFGAVMTFLAWVPLAYTGAALLGSAPAGASASPLARVLAATIVPLAIATAAGGFLVGRFGEPAGRREATLGGSAAGTIAVGLTAISGDFTVRSLVVVALATAFAALGGALGVRLRK